MHCYQDKIPLPSDHAPRDSGLNENHGCCIAGFVTLVLSRVAVFVVSLLLSTRGHARLDVGRPTSSSRLRDVLPAQLCNVYCGLDIEGPPLSFGHTT